MDEEEKTYEIVRFYFKGSPEVLQTGVTLEEAQEHCNGPEASWQTAKSADAIKRTETHGMWFEGYREE